MGCLFVVTLLFVGLACEAIEVGDKLGTEQQPWVASRNTFAFGFQTSNVTGVFNLAIWYQATPTVAVWRASHEAHDHPLEVSGNAQIVVGRNGLAVTDGSQEVWSTKLGCYNCVANASMEDTGNFVLFNNSGQTVWQSFQSPTDTLLPHQELVGNMSLVSGKYRLSMNQSSVALYYNDYSVSDSYWSILNQQFSSGRFPPRLTFTEDGNITFYDASGTSWYRQKYDNSHRYTIDYQDPMVELRRITLERNGTLRSYSLVKGNTTWRVVWQCNLLECEVYGTCGAFGVCSYSPRKSCSCPPGFRPVNANDVAAGCTYKLPLNLECNSTAKSSKSKMLQISDRATYVGNDYFIAPNSTSLEGCKSFCLEDCKCLAAVYRLDGSGQCILKGGSSNASKLYNGVQSAQQAFIALIKVSALDSSASSPEDVDGVFVTRMDGQNVMTTFKGTEDRGYFCKTPHVVVFALAVGEFVSFFAVALVAWFSWRRYVHKMWKKAASEKRGATRFSYEQLQVATNNFSEKLGSGGFGSVYKGMLPDKTVVAVKNLEVATHGESQFKTEVTTLGRIHHVNLVRLLGYCADENHKSLVYEYMSNGSLDKVLFSEDTSSGSDKLKLWGTRYSVALGIAKGITYLHEECYERILHCDIKPQNILLDQDFCPKVSDFGLAKLMKKEMALSVTTIRGTRGYLAPEWISNQPITAKVDVYSYGMLLLELLSGRDVSKATTTSSFSMWAFQKYTAGDLESIIDQKVLPSKDVDWAQFEKTLKVAFWCIQPDANSRPTMGRLLQMLEEQNSEVVMPPSPGGSVKGEAQSHGGSSTDGPMSILEPR